MTLVAFEAMAVPTGMPTAVRELHGLAHYGWAFSGFIIANIIGMVASAWHAHITLSMLALARLAGAKALAVKGEPAPSNRHDQLYVPRATTTARALILRHDHRPDHVWSWSRRRRRRRHQACISHYGDEVSAMSAVAVLGLIERLMRLYVVCCVAAVVQVRRIDNSLPPSRSADSAA